MVPAARLAQATPLTAVALDHVAIAVDDLDAAVRWWRERGATPVVGGGGSAFSTEQVRLSNGGKVELLSHGRDPGFVAGFLDRFGSGRIHHLTLRVAASLPDAVEQLRGAGLDVVDVSTAHEHWHEAFLRPSQAGGLVVQVAWASGDDADFAVRAGRGVPPPPDPEAPPLRQVVLGHPDLDAAAALWQVLGATVRRGDGGLIAGWQGSPVEVAVRPAGPAGPLGLVLDGTPAAATSWSPAVLDGEASA